MSVSWLCVFINVVFPLPKARQSKGSLGQGYFFSALLVLNLILATGCCLSSSPGSLFAHQRLCPRACLEVTQTKVGFPKKFQHGAGEVRVSLGLRARLRFLQVPAQLITVWPKVSCLLPVYQCFHPGFVCSHLFRLNFNLPLRFSSVANCWHHYSVPGIISSRFCCDVEIACSWKRAVQLRIEEPALPELNKGGQDETQNQLLHAPEASEVPAPFPGADCSQHRAVLYVNRIRAAVLCWEEAALGQLISSSSQASLAPAWPRPEVLRARNAQLLALGNALSAGALERPSAQLRGAGLAWWRCSPGGCSSEVEIVYGTAE